MPSRPKPPLRGRRPSMLPCRWPLSLIWRGAAPATPFLFRRARKRRHRNRLQWRNARSFAYRLQHFAGGVEQVQMFRREGRGDRVAFLRSEEHTSELQSLMRISYAVFCLKKKNLDLFIKT